MPFVDQQVQAQLLLLQGYINTTAIRNGLVFPDAKVVRQGGGLVAPIWPSNPWTGKVMTQGTSKGTYTYSVKADHTGYTLVGHLSVGSYKLTGGVPKWVSSERDAQTRASLVLVQQYVEMWGRDHSGTFPQAADLAQNGAVGQQRTGLLWPTNPWTGAPMAAGERTRRLCLHAPHREHLLRTSRSPLQRQGLHRLRRLGGSASGHRRDQMIARLAPHRLLLSPASASSCCRWSTWVPGAHAADPRVRVSAPKPERTSARIRAAHLARRPTRASATLLALAIIFVLAYVFIIRAPAPATVPELAAIQGTFTWKTPALTTTGEFFARASGDAAGRSQAAGASVVSRYDAARRRELTVTTAASATTAAATVDAWPPLWRTSTSSPLTYQGISAIVRSAVEDGDASVGIKPGQAGGRDVWRAALRFGPRLVETVVDQRTGLVTWLSTSSGGMVETFSATVSSSTATPPNLSAPSPSAASLSVTRVSGRTYQPNLAAAGAAAGFVPLRSTLHPDGYVLRAVATRRGDLGGLLGGTVPGAPVGRGVTAGAANEIDLVYSRGLVWFVVNELDLGDDATAARRAMTVANERLRFALSGQTSAVQYGEFGGQTAYSWYGEQGPTVFVADRRYAVLISGGLTRQEALSAADGFKPLP